MKKLAALVGILAVLALVPAQAASAEVLDLSAGVFPDGEFTALSSSGDPFAVGGGTITDATQFAFSAHLGPGGASGYGVVKTPALGEAQGRVVCYIPNVPNTRAVFEIEVEKGSGLAGSADFLEFEVDDLGEPPSANPDQLAVFGGNGTCGGVGIVVAGFFVAQGNVVVQG